MVQTKDLPPELLPADLRNRGQWVCWKKGKVASTGKFGKIPYNAKTAELASSTDPITWSSFAQVIEVMRNGHGYSGAGFVISPNDLFVGIDLDHCIVFGSLKPWAARTIQWMNTYTEVSPSGSGVKLWLKARMPASHRNKRKPLPESYNDPDPDAEIEMYSRNRFFTVTGKHLIGTPLSIENRQEEVEVFYKELFGEDLCGEVTSHDEDHKPDNDGFGGPDDELLDLARKASNGEKFKKLFDEGEISDYANDDSRADAALCTMLAFWTGPNPERIEQLFGRSKLAERDKWQREDYRERTIKAALTKCKEFYHPSGKGGTDPTFLAQQFLKPYTWTPDTGGQSLTTLRRWREEWYLWQDRAYMRLLDDTIKLTVTNFLQEGKKQKKRIGIKIGLVGNVALNLQAMTYIHEKQELNTFLDGVDRGHFISLENGLLNLSTRELVPPTPNYFTAVSLPYAYDAGAKCPQFDTFLNDVMLGRQGYIELVQEFIGYLFRTDVREQKFLLCVGEGANGKGVVFEVTQALIGPQNCSQVPISRFGDRFSLYSTIGKICNLTHESSHVLEDEAENVLKSYVSGDRMTIDRKHRDPIEIQPTAKLLIATNSLPRFGDKTMAVWRRILLVPFDLSLDEKYQIKNMAEQLKRELPGILNWALAGLDRLNANRGFTVPQGQQDLMEEYRRDSDPARSFLLDHYEGSLNGAYVPCADVYKAYRAFCEGNGCRAMGERGLGQHVRRLFPGVTRRYRGPRANREYVYEGLVCHVC